MVVSNISFIFGVEAKILTMKTINEIERPSKAEQKVAIASYIAIASAIQHLKSDRAEIEIEETSDRIVIPVKALKLLSEVLKAMSEGKPISIVPIATEVTTQKAAEILGCSRPFMVKLLEEGKIEFTKVGKHRRILLEDVMAYKKQMKEEQKKLIVEMMNFDEDLGLYDS